jgi:hypothetical protein
MENLDHWPAQQPSADFAAHVAAAILTEPRRVVAAPRWRKPTLLILAAAFISASAWGAAAVIRSIAPPPALSEIVIAPSPKPSVPQVPMGSQPEIRAQQPPEAVKRTPAPAVVSKHPAVLPSQSSAPLPRPRVPAPRCECGPGAIVCGCIE